MNIHLYHSFWPPKVLTMIHHSREVRNHGRILSRLVWCLEKNKDHNKVYCGSQCSTSTKVLLCALFNHRIEAPCSVLGRGPNSEHPEQAAELCSWSSQSNERFTWNSFFLLSEYYTEVMQHLHISVSDCRGISGWKESSLGWGKRRKCLEKCPNSWLGGEE
jgi:hypothetical protein